MKSALALISALNPVRFNSDRCSNFRANDVLPKRIYAFKAIEWQAALNEPGG